MATPTNGSKETENGSVTGTSIKSPFLEVAAVALWLAPFHLNVVILVVCLFFLPNIWAFTVLGLWLAQLLIPTFNNTPLSDRVATFVCTYAPKYFPINAHVEDLAAFDSNRSYVLAAEPHSVFPVGVIALTQFCGLLPLKKIRVGGSSALLWTPVVRHVWSAMGMVPASRKIVGKLLGDGSSIVLVPGGVQECLYLERGSETIFLKKRYGFVRCAIEAGSPLVPVFCFGQSDVYHYLKPSGTWYGRLSRALGFTPMLFWGAHGSPVPYRHPIHMVVGKPIEVEKKANPSREEVSAMLGKFIGAMEELFKKHKEAAGYKDISLRVL